MKIIIVGAGEVGAEVGKRLSQEGLDVCLIDKDSENLERVNEKIDVQTVLGSGSSPKVLIEAGISEAELLIAVTGSDESNLFTCKLAQLLAPKTSRMARVRDTDYYLNFSPEVIKDDLGVDFIINPDSEAVKDILDLLTIPGATDVVNLGKGRLLLIGVRLFASNPLANKNLSESVSRDKNQHLLIAAIYRNNELLIPTGKTILRPHDLIYLATTPNNTKEVCEFFNLNTKPIKDLVIIGGGAVGSHLAKELEKQKHINIKLIEINHDRCQFLSQYLDRTMILKGDGTDQSLLLEENINLCDAFVALTSDDEKNVISCLLAKRMGVKNLITRINKFSYLPLVAAIGLESLVSSRLAAISAVLKNIRRGRVLSLSTLKSQDAEIIEYEVLENSKIAGLTMIKAPFPVGSLVISIIREELVIIPKGKTVILPGDILVTLAKPEIIPSLEKLLSIH